MQISDIYIIGSGNLSWHLTHLFVNEKLPVKGIWSKNKKTLEELANSAKVKILNKHDIFKKTNSVYFLCVNDNSIETLAKKLKNNFLIHCSGSTDIQTIAKYTENAGVFYPLQTFTRKIKLGTTTIPILIEATNDNVKQMLINIANELKQPFYIFNSKERLLIHLSAVIANNFSNFMITLAQDTLKCNNINPSILNPLIEETFIKAINYGACNSQTGPAIRNDIITIKKHLNELNNEDLKKIYRFVTKNIIKYYNK